VKILDRYILRTFLGAFALVAVFVYGIYVVVDVFPRMGELLEAQQDLDAAGRTVLGVLLDYYLVSMPYVFQLLLPFITLIAATIAIVQLMRGNEIAPMLAAGHSPARILRPIFLIAALVSLLMLAMQEWGIPRLAAARANLELLAKGNFEGSMDDVPPLIDDNGNTWAIELYFPGQRKVGNVSVVRFKDPRSGEVRGSLFAEEMIYREDGPGGAGFYPVGGRLYPAENSPDFGRVMALSPDRPVETNITPREVELEVTRDSREAGKMMSLSESARLARLYPDIPRQRVAFHSLITWPLANLLLIMLGLPIILRMGEQNLFAGVGLAIAVSAFYFAVSTLFQDLGGRGSLAPTLAAWLTVVLSVSAIVALKER
jgi:lipopolysaccharide export system permease protein